MTHIRHHLAGLLLASAATGALAQAAQQPAAGAVSAADQSSQPAQSGLIDMAEQQAANEIVVVGTLIRGAKATGALPVIVLDTNKIDATGAVSGDELIRSIPQMGDVSFNPSNNAQTSNAARGDVGSIDLRGLGVGSTLVLVNGRRVVTNAASQGLSDTGTVPVLSYNSNALPITSLQRLEVLLDGAAAIYGSDAVAGVVNTVLRDNYDGVRASVQYGGGEGTHLREFQSNLLAGTRWKSGSVTASFEFTQRTALRAEDQDYTATADQRRYFVGTPFEGVTGADTRNTRGVWPALNTPTTNGTIRQGTRALTTAAGSFHIRPVSFGSCAAQLPNQPQDICLVNTTLPTTGVFRDLRYDTARGTTVLPQVSRYNFFLNGRQEVSDNLELFTEIGMYYADTDRIQPAVINLNPIWIPAGSYWNPFGPVEFPNGQANPNRIAGLTNVPATGLPVRMNNYRFADTGPQTVNVQSTQARLLIGLRGETLGFKWDSALVYSQATSLDRSSAVKSSLLQRSLAQQTPAAYNPFNGGCVADLGFGDCTPSSQQAIDSIMFTLRRFSKTTLAMGDFRASNARLFALPAGPVGLALGVEVRRETQFDDRDSAVDGSAPFIDAVTGEVTLSDAAAVSPNPDTGGGRTIAAAFAEFAVPVISPDMNVPLIQSIDLQIAGRFEHYSDFGSIARPKIAAAWVMFDGLKLRGSYSEGFRAPNLEQTNALQYARNALAQDYIRCEADLRARRITDFTRCGNNPNFSRVVAGNPALEPETSRNLTLGVVLEPKFLPSALGQLSFTVDYWRIDQRGLVGVLGNEIALAQDYLLRLQGSSNPAVVRATPTADDVAFFAGTGLAPAGTVLQVLDQFRNLRPQTVRGLDFGAYWTLPDTAIGSFELAVNATRMLEFSRDPGDAVDALVAARAAGQINIATPLPETANLLEANGRPKWRGLATLTWTLGRFQLGAAARYTGRALETGFVDPQGNPWVIKDQLTANTYAQYRFGDKRDGFRFRVGVRNITNEAPPLTSEGFNGFLYNPIPRYWYASMMKAF
ncbi:MAG: TonB-dependent receptor [Alphaproteobacteria bacterium]|nr:TonB-dependent receptor [Alphaproteobacteria bacterium]